MSDPVITNINNSNVILKDAEFRDELLTLAGADVILAGTILARDSVSLKLVLFAKGGVTNENGIPKVVLTYQVTSTGAGDSAIRAMVSGDVRKEKLVIDADQDDSNVDAAVIDELRDYDIVALNVQELNIQDNQP